MTQIFQPGTLIEAQQVTHGMIVDYGPDRIDVVQIFVGPNSEITLVAGNNAEYELCSIDTVTVRGYFNPDAN